MHRYNDWPERLTRLLDERRDMPFCWGVQDCALFASDAVLAMTGVDLAEDLRGYADELGAARALRELLGSEPLGEATSPLQAVAMRMAASHGLEAVLPAYARRGDVLLLVTEGRDSLAIMGINGRPVGTGPRGLREFPLEAVIAAWRIP